MQIGQRNVPDERRWQKRIRPRDFPVGKSHAMRIINGPVHRWMHLWPTQVEDPTTNVMKNTWHSAFVQREQSTLLDKLAQIDVVLKQKHLKNRPGVGEKELKAVRSMLRKGDRYDYAVIPRNFDNEVPGARVFEANWSIYSAIKEAAKKIDPVNPKMLMYGLCYMYDIGVTKVINERTRQFNYTVDVLLPCPTAGKIPDVYLDTEKHPIENPSQYFSAQDLELIKSVDWELDTLDQPITDEELVKTLKEFPIDLGRRDTRNSNIFIFFNDKEDFQALQSFATNQGLPVLIPTQNDMGALSLPPGSGALAAPPENAVDADFENVPDAAPAYSAPAPSAPAPASAAGTGTAPASAPMAEKVAPTRTNLAPNMASQPAPAPASAQQAPPKPGLARPNLW